MEITRLSPETIVLQLTLTQEELDYITFAVGRTASAGFEVDSVNVYQALIAAGGKKV